MSYIDAVLEKDKNRILVVERTVGGQRKIVEYTTKYEAYWPDPRGKYNSIYPNVKLNRLTETNGSKFQKEVRMLQGRVHEADINPVFRCLYENYRDKPLENLHIGFLDIETDFDPVLGFSSTEEAFSPITAITVYCTWLERNFTLVCKPKTLSVKQAQSIVDEFEDTVLCADEKSLLEAFLVLIEDADILSGWNSEGYDMPYIHNRILKILGRDETRKLCLCGKLPKKREYEQYGKMQITWDIVGRVHLDYLQLYRKHTYHEMHSYRLDFVGEYEVGEKKIHYEGTLDHLYNNDFKKFIEYNRQDVMLLVKLDNKLKFIELSSNLAHDNSVLFNTTMGAVALIDQAIVNAAWEKELKVPVRKRDQNQGQQEVDFEQELYGQFDMVDDDDNDDEIRAKITGVAGAYVAQPQVGLHDWIGTMDINSLYPSAIRALNMSPESIVGQLRLTATNSLIFSRMKLDKATFAAAWGDQFGTIEYRQVMGQDDTTITIDFEDGSELTVPAVDVYNMIFDKKSDLILSANGTMYNKSKVGIIPGLLAEWYSGRKVMQKESKKYAQMADEHRDQPEKYQEYKKLAAYWDQRQLIRKILLNSTYGALGNAGSRWFDARLAQSTTLTGRCIAKHMHSKTNEIIAGTYDHTGPAIIYGDTDSSMFSAYKIMRSMPEFADFEWTKENITNLYDQITDIVNNSFSDFMQVAFNCTADQGSVIRAGRELCAIKGLFITKKRYAVLVYDKEGKRKDQNGAAGEIKAMGLDLKRSDTPKPVQEFLNQVLEKVLTTYDQAEIQDYIKNFRDQFRDWDPWHMGSPKRVNNLTRYQGILAEMRDIDLKNRAYSGRKTIPGHVMASLNWNQLRTVYNDHYSIKIQDGAKVIVCKLRNNTHGINSIAYPVDEMQLPDWFKRLPFDREAMEAALIDKKLKNLLSVLDLDISDKNDTTFNQLFTF